MIIYKITNQLNKMIYIGCTKLSLEERKKAHISHSKYIKKQPIHKAMDEFGIENFLFEILEETDNGKIRENFYIEKYLNNNFELYNVDKKSCISTSFFSYDIETGKIEEHLLLNSKKYNAARLSEVLNKKTTKINGKEYERFSYKGKLWSYINDEENWNSLLELNSKKKTMCKKRKVMIIETGQVFNSQKEANIHFGSKGRSTKIGNAIKSGYTTHGYHWEYVE